MNKQYISINDSLPFSPKDFVAMWRQHSELSALARTRDLTQDLSGQRLDISLIMSDEITISSNRVLAFLNEELTRKFGENAPYLGISEGETDEGEHVSAVVPLNEWVNVLLDSPSITNEDLRDSIVAELPLDIQGALIRKPALKADVRSLVRTCSNYVEGPRALVYAIQAIEGNSITVQRLHQLLDNLHIA